MNITTSNLGLTPQRPELLTKLHDKYGVPQVDVEAIGRTGLMRIIETFDFLSNNLPPNSLTK